MARENPYIRKPRTDFKDVRKLSRGEAEREAGELREAIDHHDYLYYVKDSPIISDAVYDRLFKRLEELEKAFPELVSDTSPTRRVGAPPVEKLRKTRHTAPMLSLNSALEEGEVADFDRFVRQRLEGEKLTYVLEPKFDGFSVEVVYENGVLKYGATRGDGETGEEISENLKTIGAVPIRLRKTEDTPRFLSVRGEVYMPMEGFQALNKRRLERGEEPFANPRNAAAGIMRQLDSRMVADKPLDIVFYEVLRMEGREFASHWNVLERFLEWGLRTDEHIRRTSSLEEIKKYHRGLLEKRDDLGFEIDGVVIKLDDLRQREALGTRQRSPRWALAWKFPPREEVSAIQDIVVQVGRTGMLTPVALLEPVDVGGVTVSRATLHNEGEVRKKDVRKGDKVRVVRAGDVIPEVLERVETGRKRGREFSMPSRCPACGSAVKREGAYYFCTAELSCPAQLLGHIAHYSSRSAMNIEELGEKTVRQLIEKGMVKDLADLYELKVEDLLKLEGFAQKSARNLYEGIQMTKKARLDRFVYALGIRHVGEHVARVLARRFGSLDALGRASLEELRETREIGPQIAQSVRSFFGRKENLEVLHRLRALGVEVGEVSVAAEKELQLSGMTFVFTGELEGFTRSEAKALVESLGGRAASSVSGGTDYVVAGRSPGSKLEEARKRNVKVISEKEFKKLVK